MFLFRKRQPAPKPHRPATVTEEQRKAYRASFEFPIVYAVDGREGMRTAIASDLSAGGLRIVGDEDLPERTPLTLRFTLPNELVAGEHVEKEVEQTTPGGKVKRKVMVPPDPFHEMRVSGRVVVAFLNVSRRRLMHGVQFVDIDERTQEEIQRFIHVWQIRQLRERALHRGE
ncbi:MAG TPA: PilZ domain-containing protein [Candidatus Limnocylindria bacterium]|nr:PilZ domain-containing protein [Candidatus Limnocylindria bacterium]